MTNIPDLSASVGAPRIAAVEHPLGRTLGQPGDGSGQSRILHEALKAGVEIDHPGGIRHLPYSWSESPREAMSRRIAPPPITTYLKTHPWEFPRFLNRNVPEKYLIDVDG